MRDGIDVRTLVCHRDVALGIRCLPTLLKFSAEPMQLVLHDDGSLTDDDVGKLLDALPGASVLRREEADDRMAGLLRNHPWSAEFRRTHPFALKLLDATLASADGLLRYCDTDIVFFRPYQGLFDVPPGVDAMFMADTHDTYAWRSWQLLRRRARVVARANAGLMCFRVNQFDLDRVEWALRQPITPQFAHFIEQTAWAVLAAPLVVHHWNTSQVRIVADGVRQPETLVAGHYIGPFRHLLETVSDDDFAHSSAPPVHVGTRPARSLGAAQVAWREGRRWVARRLGKAPGPGHDAYADAP